MAETIINAKIIFAILKVNIKITIKKSKIILSRILVKFLFLKDFQEQNYIYKETNIRGIIFLENKNTSPRSFLKTTNLMKSIMLPLNKQ